MTFKSMTALDFSTNQCYFSVALQNTTCMADNKHAALWASEAALCELGLVHLCALTRSPRAVIDSTSQTLLAYLQQDTALRTALYTIFTIKHTEGNLLFITRRKRHG